MVRRASGSLADPQLGGALAHLLRAGYTLLHNGHVRVDIFYRPASRRYKAWIDILGSLLLLLPMVTLVFLISTDYVANSWSRLEESREAGGLPGLFLLKTVIPAFCLLLGLQGLALIGRSLHPLLTTAGFSDVTVSPRMVYADASHPERMDRFVAKTIVPMVEGVEEQVRAEGVMTRADGDSGLERVR